MSFFQDLEEEKREVLTGDIFQKMTSVYENIWYAIQLIKYASPVM